MQRVCAGLLARGPGVRGRVFALRRAVAGRDWVWGAPHGGWPSRRAYATTSVGGHPPAPPEEPLLDFDFDPLASVRQDVVVEAANKNREAMVESLLPPNAPPSAAHRIRQYLIQHPVDSLILLPQVQITHVQSPDTETEERVSLSPCPLAEALVQARGRGMNLVQMGSKGDLAFCRIRHEKRWINQLIAEDMKEVAEAHAPEAASHALRQPRPQVDHPFRDVVDAHFVSWRSKKICQDLRKGHPVKLTIKEFQSAESAVHKLREMSLAMKHYAEAEGILHHFTSLVGNDREAAVTFAPSMAGKSGTAPRGVKHPGEKEWAHMLKRMQDACQKAGRIGTYMKSGALKPRSVGTTLYRVDKYGRRID